MLNLIYESLSSKANRTDELAWVVGRVALIAAVLVGTALFMRGTTAEVALYVCAGFAFVYNLPLLAMLLRGRIKAAFVSGFILDNATLFVGWWFCVTSLAGQKQTNDLYLILAPILIIGVARLGWRTGVVYTIAWLTWMGVTHYIHYGPGSYDVEQMPLRLAFIGAGSIIAGRLVARLDREKLLALQLRSESDAVAEIGRLAGSTLSLREVFQPIARVVSDIIPYSGLSVVELDHEHGSFTVTAEAGRELGIWEGSTNHDLTRTLMSDLASKNRPVVLDASGCQMLLAAVARNIGETAGTVNSMLLVPAMANETLIAVLVAWSEVPGAFKENELRVMSRVSAHLSGAVANARLYAHSLELNRVKEVSEAKSSLLSTVSHELRTPLTSVVAFTDLLSRDKDGNLTERQKHQISMIKRGEKQLVGLIDDLLDVSRIESGKISLELQQLQLSDIVAEVVESLGPLLQERNQRIAVDIEKSVGSFVGDRLRLQQVIRNLLTNAAKYSGDGSTILVVGRKRDDQLCIQVVDSGIGITPQDMEGLFTPFYRTSNPEATKKPGTGLGLAIVKGLIEAHHGTIEVASNPGMGTTFTVTVPVDSSGTSGDLGQTVAA